MNSRKDIGKSIPASVDAGGILSTKEKNYEESSNDDVNPAPLIDELTNLKIECKQDGAEMSTSQSIGGDNAGRSSHDSWDQAAINFEGLVNGENSKDQQSNNGWCSWSAMACRPGLNTSTQVTNINVQLHDELITAYDYELDNGVDDNDELLDDSEDDISDGFDSDDSQMSHDSQKKNKWLWPFFESLDSLSLEQIDDQVRQWHCPACQDGPGSIDWYVGIRPLMAHAKTKRRMRIRLHRKFAEILEEELQRRGVPLTPAGEAFGKWKGLGETTVDHEIVWPPMVVVMNTRLEKDENDKWKGMGNQELLEYFNTYAAVKARHSYGPKGHRGLSVLIFEASAMGYLEAERLHRQFIGEGRGRNAWERNPVLFYPGGKRRLYGFLASKEDLVVFCRHSRGKLRLKFEIKSYLEMVVRPMKQMSEDNQKLVWLENKVIKQEQHSKAFEETFGTVSRKLRETMEENRIVRLRTNIQHEVNKEEEQMEKIRKITEEKEVAFEKLLLEERAKASQSDINSGTIADCRQMKEEIQTFVASQLKGVEMFEAEKANLMHAHEEKKIELRRKHLTEHIELEKNFVVELTKLMEKYTPSIQISG